MKSAVRTHKVETSSKTGSEEQGWEEEEEVKEEGEKEDRQTLPKGEGLCRHNTLSKDPLTLLVFAFVLS